MWSTQEGRRLLYEEERRESRRCRFCLFILKFLPRDIMYCDDQSFCQFLFLRLIFWSLKALNLIIWRVTAQWKKVLCCLQSMPYRGDLVVFPGFCKVCVIKLCSSLVMGAGSNRHRANATDVAMFPLCPLWKGWATTCQSRSGMLSCLVGVSHCFFYLICLCCHICASSQPYVCCW